jgi:hypothetical protein
LKLHSCSLVRNKSRRPGLITIKATRSFSCPAHGWDGRTFQFVPKRRKVLANNGSKNESRSADGLIIPTDAATDGPDSCPKLLNTSDRSTALRNQKRRATTACQQREGNQQLKESRIICSPLQLAGTRSDKGWPQLLYGGMLFTFGCAWFAEITESALFQRAVLGL